MVLNKVDLLTEMALKTETVTLPAGDVLVSEIGAADYIKIYSNPEHQGPDGAIDMAKFTPALVACCVVDETGARMFSDEEAADLGRKSMKVFNRLAAAARRLNGLAGDEGN